MEDGETYKVVYSDGQRERVKILVFKKKESPLLYFFNPRKDKEEIINEDRIIRMEEMDPVNKEGRDDGLR